MSLLSLVAVLCLAAIASGNPRSVRQTPTSCTYYCPTGQGIGSYFCCDEDTSPDAHLGSCPRQGATDSEINPPCKRDSDCFQWEKCCHDLYTEEKVCMLSTLLE